MQKGKRMLEKIKIRLASMGILSSKDDESKDDVLMLMLADATDAVLTYCHRNKLPMKLEYIIRDLVVREIQAENADNVSSVKRGDTQITYTQSITKDNFTEKEICALNAYRRLRMG